MTKQIWVFVAVAIFLLTGCKDKKSNPQDNSSEMLIYCGITMVKPIKELSKIFKKRYNCKVDIVQGGSEDLYQSLIEAKRGDLYLPGSESYIKSHKKDGNFLKSVYVGKNVIALFVKKDNPLHIKASLSSLADLKYRVVISDPNTSSIGKATKLVLEKAGLYDQVYKNVIYLATDSRGINKMLLQDQCDVALNWRATAYFDDTKDKITALDLDPKYSLDKKLMLTMLKFTSNKKLAEEFMDLATSKKGKEIFKKYGF